MNTQAILADIIEELYEMPRLVTNKPLDCCFMLGSISQRLQFIIDDLDKENNDNQLHGC